MLLILATELLKLFQRLCNFLSWKVSRQLEPEIANGSSCRELFDRQSTHCINGETVPMGVCVCDVCICVECVSTIGRFSDAQLCMCVCVCFRSKKSSHLSKPTVRVQFTLCLKDTTLCVSLCLCVYVYVLTASGLKFAL